MYSRYDGVPKDLKNKEEVFQWLVKASSDVDKEALSAMGFNDIYRPKIMANTLQDSLFDFYQNEEVYGQIEGFILTDGTSILAQPSHSIVLEILSAATLGISVRDYLMNVPKLFWTDMLTLGINITKTLLIYPSFQLVVGTPTDAQMKTLSKIDQTFPDRIVNDVHKEPDLNFPTVFTKDAWLNN